MPKQSPGNSTGRSRSQASKADVTDPKKFAKWLEQFQSSALSGVAVQGAPVHSCIAKHLGMDFKIAPSTDTVTVHSATTDQETVHSATTASSRRHRPHSAPGGRKQPPASWFEDDEDGKIPGGRRYAAYTKHEAVDRAPTRA